MTYYNFYLENNLLVCAINIGNMILYKKDIDALKILNRLSNDFYRDIEISEDFISFASFSVKIAFKDFDKIFTNYTTTGSFNFIKQLKKKITKQQFQKVGDKIISKSKFGIAKAMLSATTMLLLLNLDKSNSFGMPMVSKKDTTSNLSDEQSKYISDLEQQVDKIIASELNKDNISTDVLESDATIKNTYSNVMITCDENGYSDEIIGVMENYGPTLNEAANTFGISTNLLVAMLTQESHGEGNNLMQISINGHYDEVKQVYNYMNNKYEEFVITQNPDKYKDAFGDYKCRVYTADDLKDPYNNIMCGASLLSYYYNKYCGHNLFAALVCYNQGPGTVNNVIKDTAQDYNVTVENILSDSSNLSFIDKVHELKSGDPYYIEHVMQYVTDADRGIYISNNDKDYKYIVYVEKNMQKKK